MHTSSPNPWEAGGSVGWIDLVFQSLGVPPLQFSALHGLLLECGVCIVLTGLVYWGLSGASSGDFSAQWNVDALWLAPIVPTFLALTRFRHGIQKWAFARYPFTKWACVTIVVVTFAVVTWIAYYGVPLVLVRLLAGADALSIFSHDKGFFILGVILWLALIASARRDLGKIISSKVA